MKFALINGERHEASPGLNGVCIGCGSPTLAKCGEIRVNHWAHQGQRRCDPWWESETEWHRAWKNQFPSEWQEVIHHAGNGEKHIADVKTEAGWTLEFQHSSISPDERKARDDFYKKLFWVVDGLRVTQAKTRFSKALVNDALTHRYFPEIKVIPSKKVSLLQSWSNSNSHVILDFGDELLWWLRPESDGAWSYLVSIPRLKLVAFHNQASSTELKAFIEKYDEVLSQRGSYPSLADYYYFQK
jgi:competence protein CoiA